MGSATDVLADRAYLVLDESLPLIDAALISYYGFTPSESEAFKDTLAIWFHRVAQRSGTRYIGNRELREQLLLVACKYARAFQLAKADNGMRMEDQFANALQTPPEEVALALLNKIQAMAAPL